MSDVSATCFYVQKPQGQHWKVGFPDWVIEAKPIDTSENLFDWQKTAEYTQAYLKVVNPKNFGSPHIRKDLLVECSGPARKLKFEEYVALYHSLKPDHPLPKGWKPLTSKL